MSTDVPSPRRITARHPGESREPSDFARGNEQSHWVPAFAGMTSEKRVIREGTSHA